MIDLFNICAALRRRSSVIMWISVVIYLFYDTFTAYNTGKQYRHLRNILGIGLCISRATATVLNVSCALVLMPVCKKFNQLLYYALAKIWPKLFFFWLESAKSCHMILATTLVSFAEGGLIEVGNLFQSTFIHYNTLYLLLGFLMVSFTGVHFLHSGAHIVNLWNFSKHYDDQHKSLNLAHYKNQNPLELLATLPGCTGISMLLITTLMACSSLRCVRRKHYNIFRYTHQLFFLFIALLLVHPLSGALKEEVIIGDFQLDFQTNMGNDTTTANGPVFIPIKSKTWVWMSLPMLLCSVDLLWRFCTRNQASVTVLEAHQLPGRAISLTLSCPSRHFKCRVGQYLLIQCSDISVLEWHPFSVTKENYSEHSKWYVTHGVRVTRTWPVFLNELGQQVPSYTQPYFSLLVRVKGDWTESLEKLVEECTNLTEKPLRVLVDGPYSSPLESMMSKEVALCVAAGVGITPFASLLFALLEKPRNRYPGRIHLIWIVRSECELSWIAELATQVLYQLREANRPDRLLLELYVTNNFKNDANEAKTTHIVNTTETGKIYNSVNFNEKTVLLTPKRPKKIVNNFRRNDSTVRMCEDYKRLLKRYPLLGCRIRCGRPRWEQLFEYWIHLYPRGRLQLYCCGPKKLISTLQDLCVRTNQKSKTRINLIHERFS